ncbi:MAG: hypothetical protein HY755_00630 [Nitrospirae bacterium]|nr:hypothetical protein [Nitrospirota bacterium]
MTERWDDGLSDDALLSEQNRAYKEMIDKIKTVVEGGMGFDEACKSIDTPDDELRKALSEDALKVLIAEMHFMRKIPTDKVAEMLKISVERVNSAKDSMLKEIEDSAIQEFHKGIGIQD